MIDPNRARLPLGEGPASGEGPGVGPIRPDPPSATESLRQIAPESLLAIFETLREGVLVVDPDLRVIALNQAAVELLGRDLASLAGRPVCDLFGAPPCPSDQLDEAMRSGKPILDFQTPIVLADGSQGSVLIRTASLQRRDGPPVGIAIVLVDVTEVTQLRKQVDARERFGAIIGRNPRMQELYRLIEQVATSDAGALIRGESGTGKELVARAIHNGSGRADGPFVQVNCSALSEGLLESELFGHVRGSFTGAVGDRRGRFEEAHGGTLFLDEIGDVSPVVQVKLLRVLQERVIERVGENRPIRVDVRIVSATNRDLEALLASGRLREDFYYRIKVVSLRVPPLRERREDIPLLVEHLLRRSTSGAAAGAGGGGGARAAVPRVDPRAMEALLSYDWPGNVRELENALEHARVLGRGGVILSSHLPPEILRPAARRSLRDLPTHSEAEKEAIRRALEATGWNRTRAARRLGVDRTTLWRKIREHGLEPEV